LPSGDSKRVMGEAFESDDAYSTFFDAVPSTDDV